MPIIDKKTQKMFDSVTDDIIKDGQKQTQNISTVGGFAHRYEKPLKDEHPGLNLALMYAQPGNILAKLMAPSMAKGMVNSIASGDTEGLLAAVVPGGTQLKATAAAKNAPKSVVKPISEAEKLGIPKSMRSNPKALEDPQYWGYQQWNQRYNAAIESGNIGEAQRLRDLHFKIKAFNNQLINVDGSPLTLYHGNIASNSKIRSMGLNPYSTYRNSRQSSGYFAVEDPNIAKTYTFMPDSKIHSLYGYSKNPMNINANGHSWTNVDAFNSTDDIVNKAFNSGHDAVKINNVVDYGVNTPANHPRTPFTDYVFKPGRVKLKDAIVRDGLFDEVIPIVKRDNFHNLDIRYKQGGIIKAQDGTFEGFWNTLSQDQQDSTDFNVRRYWELNGKPVNFKEAIKRGMYKKEKDGYHANSIAFNEETGEYEFMKSPNHPTIQYELNWFNSNKANKFRNKYQLDSTSIPWKYVPKGQDGIGRSIWQQISSPQQTYIDGYGTERPVSESKAITVGRNVYNTLGNFFNGKDRDLSDTEYQEKYGYGKPIGEVGVIGLVGNTGVKFAKYFNEAELNNIAIQARKNWTKLNNNQRSLIKRFFRYINEGRKYTEDSKMAERGYRQSVDAIKKIINSVNLEKPINTIKTTKPVVKNTTTHSKELQKIVDSSFEPFDEMSTLWETGSKAKTTSGFRLSDWKNGGVLKGQAGMILGSALLSRSDTIKNISDNIRTWGSNLKNHINTINRYNPEQVPVIGQHGVTTVRRAKIGPLVSARGKDPKIVENGGEV